MESRGCSEKPPAAEAGKLEAGGGGWGRGGAEEEEGERLRDSFLAEKPRWLVSDYLQEVILAIQVRKKETRPP